MKLFFDFFPIILFFVAYKIYNIYVATACAIAASFVQVMYHRVKFKKFETMHVITFLMISILGGATILLHNEMFIKWKPTAINWVFALAFFASQFIGEKSFVERLMDKQVSLPKPTWQRLNLMWVAFFLATGAANLFVAYHFDTDTWVNFKLFGILGLTFLFFIVQAIYLSKHIKPTTETKA